MSQKYDKPSALEQNTPAPSDMRWLGVHPQKQDGLFMQRIRVFGGRISWPQWRKVAELASKYSSAPTLHLTTRQDIELHNIAADDVYAVQRALEKVCLSTLTAGGDSIRNITVCSGCKFDPNVTKVLSIARIVRRYLLARLDFLTCRANLK